MRSGRGRDEAFMDRALALAAHGLGRTAPNPPVGAVFVRGGRVVGEGWTRPAGGPHAEIVALRQAGVRARGADLYVTLEPCAHHGRTPPCTDALVPLGLRRVVIARGDPNPRVRGRGVRLLRAAGVQVAVGVRADAAEALLAGHRSLVKRGRPWTVLKLGTSLDGRIALASGRSRWITGAAARRRVQALRDENDAVLVGAGTIRTDDPQLTCRLRGGRHPIRVVLTGKRVMLPCGAHVLRDDTAPTWVVVPRDASGAAVARLRRRGIEVIEVGGRAGRVAFGAAARALGARGVTRLLVEGGGAVAAAALRARAVDEMAIFVAPVVIGGDGVAAVGPLGVRTLARAVRLRRVRIERIGRDLLVRGHVHYPR
jgi:diaminohydroxyphosphoribosylaminopyrimidine deaminase/5-amino-6-(5-phosphoribosylamino)uracil reductase